MIVPKVPETLEELALFEARAQGTDPLTVMYRNDVKVLVQAVKTAWAERDRLSQLYYLRKGQNLVKVDKP